MAGQGGKKNKIKKQGNDTQTKPLAAVHCHWISFAALHSLYPFVLNEVNWALWNFSCKILDNV